MSYCHAPAAPDQQSSDDSRSRRGEGRKEARGKREEKIIIINFLLHWAGWVCGSARRKKIPSALLTCSASKYTAPVEQEIVRLSLGSGELMSGEVMRSKYHTIVQFPSVGVSARSDLHH